MTLSDVSIKNPVFAWMIMAALIVFGGIAYTRMGISQLPDVDFPVVNVGLTWDGANPENMEVEVVDIIEDAISGVQGISTVSSTSRSGSANVTIEFELNKNIDIAVQEVQNAVATVGARLPKEMDPAVVSKVNPEDQPIIWLTVSAPDMKLPDLMELVRDQVKDRFSQIDGVGDIYLAGYVDPNLRVWPSRAKLNQYELTMGDVIATIQAEHAELPSGRIETSTNESNVRTMGEAPTPSEFAKLSINRRGGLANYAPIPLGAVARVEEGTDDIRRIARANGKQAVGLGIRKQRGANAVEVAKNVKKRMEEVRGALPKGADIQVRYDSTTVIEDAVHELVFTLLLSALLTALVCWAFLGSMSATMNVVLAIPTSVIGSFMLLAAFGFTLNTFTLLGLSLAIGIVVDDAIMVLENIVRHAEMGKGKRKAALEGAREITFAAFAATLAIIAIFLPVAFMKGIIGKFFFQFGVTLSASVALSLLEALTLTPMRCSEFLHTGARTTRFGKAIEGAFASLEHGYRRLIPRLLRWRWATVAAAVAFTAASYMAVFKLRKEFVPPEDQSRLIVRLQAPTGTSVDESDRLTQLIEQDVRARPEVEGTFSVVGNPDVNYSFVFVTMKPKDKRGADPKTGRTLTQQELAVVLRKDLKAPNVKVTIQDPSLSGFSAKRGYPVEMSVRGVDFDKLAAYSAEIMKRMNESGLVTDVDTDYQAGMPEIRAYPDRDRARTRAVSVTDLAQTVNASIGGLAVGKYSRSGHRYDVRVRLDADERARADDILRLNVRNNRGEVVPIADVARIEKKNVLQAISRQDRERAITIFANVAPGRSQQDALDKSFAIAKEILPDGYRAVAGGSSKTYQESFESLIFALLLGIVVAYMVLASQFNSFIHPVTVLTALPFSVSGAFLALWIGGQSLNIYSMIGLILLMGIVKKNSILLVDYANQVRAAKKCGSNEAMAEAGPMRLRPILMTSIATVAGAIPAAIAFGPGAESRAPMAIALIGGVAVSTLLTLFVVPAIYSIFSGLERPAKDDDADGDAVVVPHVPHKAV